MFNQLQRDAEALTKEIVQLVYFMRGSVSYTEMWEMTYPERKVINDFLEKHIESQSKSMHPVF